MVKVFHFYIITVTHILKEDARDCVSSLLEGDITPEFWFFFNSVWAALQLSVEMYLVLAKIENDFLHLFCEKFHNIFRLRFHEVTSKSGVIVGGANAVCPFSFLCHWRRYLGTG